MNNYIPKHKKKSFILEHFYYLILFSLTFFSLGSIRDGGIFLIFSQFDIAVLYYFLSKKGKHISLTYVCLTMLLHESFTGQSYGSGFIVYLFTVFLKNKISNSQLVKNFTIFNKHGFLLYMILLSSFLILEYCLFLREFASIWLFSSKVFIYILLYHLFFEIERFVKVKVFKIKSYT